MPFSTRTRSPLRKEGAHSWVTTRVLPSSMRKVTRYRLLEPAAVLPLVPELPTEPLLPVPLLPVVLLRGTTSIRVTTLLGVLPVEAVELLELGSWPLLAMALVLPVMPLLLALVLSMLPALVLSMLPAVVLPLVPLVPVLLVLLVSEAMLLALAGVLCAASPLVEALGVVLAVSLLPLFMPVELHAASPSASTPANSTLCSLRFMINSFYWGFFQCVRDDAACHRGMTCTRVGEFGRIHFLTGSGAGRKAQSRAAVISAALQSTSQSDTAALR